MTVIVPQLTSSVNLWTVLVNPPSSNCLEKSVVVIFTPVAEDTDVVVILETGDVAEISIADHNPIISLKVNVIAEGWKTITQTLVVSY